VNGVVASVHSEWILDPLLDWIARPDLLPAVYQAILAPVRAAYRLAGPRRFAALDARLDFGAIATDPLALSWLRAGFFLLVSLAAFPLGRRMGKRNPPAAAC